MFFYFNGNCSGEKIMYRNHYGAQVESWKIDLIVLRGKRMGFDEHDLADLQQQIVLALQNFLYDPRRANGAAESTVVVALIDRQLRMARRKATRYRKRMEQLHEEREDDQESKSNPHPLPHYEDRGQLKLDVRQALEKLDPRDRQICQALAGGTPIHQIAQEQGCGWYTIKRRMDHIRDYFQKIGLSGWLEG
jgi:RNA polymerase sigma factor (sigma-70 family)